MPSTIFKDESITFIPDLKTKSDNTSYRLPLSASRIFAETEHVVQFSLACISSIRSQTF